MSVKVVSFVPQAIKANKQGTEKAMLKTVIKVATQAKALAPVDKGQLKGSIMWKTSKESGGHTDGPQLNKRPSGLSAVVGSGLLYSIYQEYGTRKMAAKPYLRPAVDIVVNNTGHQRAVAKAMFDTVQEHLLRLSAGFVG
jgi:HK97 gp10 family phage protein